MRAMYRVFTVFSAGLLLIGCGRSPSSAPGGGEDGLTLGVIPKSTGGEFWETVEEGARAAAADLGVSMISRELFQAQDSSFRASIVSSGTRVITAEAGIGTGWASIASSTDDIFSINRFGESGQGPEVAEALGFTVSGLVKLIG